MGKQYQHINSGSSRSCVDHRQASAESSRGAPHDDDDDDDDDDDGGGR